MEPRNIYSSPTSSFSLSDLHHPQLTSSIASRMIRNRRRHSPSRVYTNAARGEGIVNSSSGGSSQRVLTQSSTEESEMSSCGDDENVTNS